jgi:ABC-type transport system involved in multi-copper enzyme maturation permease subunit
MLVKELRWGMLGRADALIRVFYISMVVYFCLGMMTDAWAGVEGVFTLILVQIIITLVIAPALLANTFTKEHEQGNYDMLRMTLLSPREVVMGKVQAGMVCMAPLVLAVFISNLPYMILVRGSLEVFFGGYVTLLVCCYLSLGISVFCSLLTTRTVTSLVVSYLVNAYAFIGVMATAFIVTIIFSVDVDEATGCYLSPIAAFVEVFGERPWSEPRDGVLTYWGSNMVLWYGIAWFFIRLTIAGYRKRLSDR